MSYFRQGPGLTARVFFFSVVAFLASRAALAQTSVADYVVIQPIDVCDSTGKNCAPFNTSSSTGNPAAATASTPIGFIDTATNKNITRAIWLQAGIDVTFLPIAQYNSPANVSPTGVYPATDYRTLHVSCGPSTCSSPDFQTLSLGQPSPPGLPSPPPPLAPKAANAINMFFVNTLAALPGTTGTFFGFAWLNGDGVAIAKNAFFPAFPLTPRFDTLAHEIGHNFNLDHFTFGAGAASSCPASFNGGSDAGCNVMDAGNLPRVIPANTTGTSTTGALSELTFGVADQLILGKSTSSTQQGQALLSGFMNPIPNVAATAGGGDVSFTVTYPKFQQAGGRAGEFIFALVLALPDGFKFGNIPFTQTGGNAQVFGTPHVLNGNNGQGNTNCFKPISGAPSIQCLEIDFVVNPNPNPPPTCPAIDPATCYNGTFTANTSISFTSEIIDKSTGAAATIAQLASGCTTPAPLQCLDLTYAFSDLFAATTFFGTPVKGISTGNSQLPDATVPSTILNIATFPSVASLNPALTVTGFSQTPCTLASNQTSCPPGMGGNPGAGGMPGGDDSGPSGTAELEAVNPILGR